MYLVIGGDGGTWGPYDFDSMRRFVAEGRVIPGTQVSVEGSNAWIPAAMVPGLFATGASPLQQPVTAVPLPPGPAAGAAGAAAPGAVGGPAPHMAVHLPPGAGAARASLVGPILVTIFCCLPFGVISIVYAAQANSALDVGNLPAAESARKNASMWMWIGAGVGFFLSGAWTLVSIVSAIR